MEAMGREFAMMLEVLRFILPLWNAVEVEHSSAVLALFFTGSYKAFWSERFEKKAP